MPRSPVKRAKQTAPAKKAHTIKKASPVKQAAHRVAADATQVRVDVDQLLESLDHLGVVALRQVVERAKVLIDEKTEGEKRSFVEEVTARAMSLGVSITDLFGMSRSKAAPSAKAGSKRASPAVKFRSPNGEEWSGRGRQPRWLTAAEAEGKKREDFAV
jgi:DNA-binding protein H-NS